MSLSRDRTVRSTVANGGTLHGGLMKFWSDTDGVLPIVA